MQNLVRLEPNRTWGAYGEAARRYARDLRVDLLGGVRSRSGARATRRLVASGSGQRGSPRGAAFVGGTALSSLSPRVDPAAWVLLPLPAGQASGSAS
jgi:hypothetical protein